MQRHDPGARYLNAKDWKIISGLEYLQMDDSGARYIYAKDWEIISGLEYLQIL